MKLIDQTKTKGARGVLLFAESAEDHEVNRGIFRLLSERQVPNGQLEQPVGDEFQSLRL